MKIFLVCLTMSFMFGDTIGRSALVRIAEPGEQSISIGLSSDEWVETLGWLFNYRTQKETRELTAEGVTEYWANLYLNKNTTWPRANDRSALFLIRQFNLGHLLK